MNNLVFGKTMQNVEKYVDVKSVCDWEKAIKLAAKPNYNRTTIFDENLVTIYMKRTKVFYDKPIYLGMAFLDLSKILIYAFNFNYMKKKYCDKAKLLYSDTDSLIYEIQTSCGYCERC